MTMKTGMVVIACGMALSAAQPVLAQGNPVVVGTVDRVDAGPASIALHCGKAIDVPVIPKMPLCAGDLVAFPDGMGIVYVNYLDNRSHPPLTSGQPRVPSDAIPAEDSSILQSARDFLMSFLKSNRATRASRAMGGNDEFAIAGLGAGTDQYITRTDMLLLPLRSSYGFTLSASWENGSGPISLLPAQSYPAGHASIRLPLSQVIGGTVMIKVVEHITATVDNISQFRLFVLPEGAGPVELNQVTLTGQDTEALLARAMIYTQGGPTCKAASGRDACHAWRVQAYQSAHAASLGATGSLLEQVNDLLGSLE